MDLNKLSDKELLDLINETTQKKIRLKKRIKEMGLWYLTPDDMKIRRCSVCDEYLWQFNLSIMLRDEVVRRFDQRSKK